MANSKTTQINTVDSSYSSVIEELDRTDVKLKKLHDFKVYHWTKTLFLKEKVEQLKSISNPKVKSAVKELEELQVREIVENARMNGLKLKFGKSMIFFGWSELSMTDSISLPIVHMFTEKNVYIFQKGDVYIGGVSQMFAKDKKINSLAQVYLNYPPLEVSVKNLFLIGSNGCIRFEKCRVQFDGPVLVYGFKLDEGFIPDYKSFITENDRQIFNDSQNDSYAFILLEVGSLRLFLMVKGKFSS